jgi:hypothetical protein
VRTEERNFSIEENKDRTLDQHTCFQRRAQSKDLTSRLNAVLSFKNASVSFEIEAIALE